MQTRKWQDQSGQDRYSTEVVLSRFRGELTLLDRAGDAISTNGGSDFGRTTPMENGRGNARPGGVSLAEELDDEIPF